MRDACKGGCTAYTATRCADPSRLAACKAALPWACNFTRTDNHAISGHNTKYAVAKTVEKCKAACCAERDFICRSFDFTKSSKKCALSDVTAADVGGLIYGTNYEYHEMIVNDDWRYHYAGCEAYHGGRRAGDYTAVCRHCGVLPRDYQPCGVAECEAACDALYAGAPDAPDGAANERCRAGCAAYVALHHAADPAAGTRGARGARTRLAGGPEPYVDVGGFMGRKTNSNWFYVVDRDGPHFVDYLRNDAENWQGLCAEAHIGSQWYQGASDAGYYEGAANQRDGRPSEACNLGARSNLEARGVFTPATFRVRRERTFGWSSGAARHVRRISLPPPLQLYLSTRLLTSPRPVLVLLQVFLRCCVRGQL